MVNNNMSLDELVKHFIDIMDNVDGQYTKVQYRTFTDDWNSLSVPVRQNLADYLKSFPGRTKKTKDKTLLKDFTNILRQQAVDDFYEEERKLIRQGKGTYNWTSAEQKMILNGETPYTIDDIPYEGQHMYSVEAYPEFAGDKKNIQALTRVDHRRKGGAHNGNTRLNQTHGYYDELTGNMILFEGEGVTKGYPHEIYLSELSPEVKKLGLYDANWENGFEEIFPGFKNLNRDQKSKKRLMNLYK